MGRRIGVPVLLILLAPWPGVADKAPPGTFRDAHGLPVTGVAIARSRFEAARRGNPLQLEHRAATRDRGHIAVLQDDGTIVTPPNRFDLAGLTLTFTPQGADYLVQSGSLEFDAGANSAVPIPLADDASSLQALPFPFPFYGATYSTIYLNTDGNLTFTRGDADSTDRSLGRIAAGVPRIAPLFSDLNPLAPGRITIERLPGRILFTWTDVGEWTPSGSSGRNTFQVALEPSGRIRYSYRTVELTAAVAAIHPGTISTPPTIIDLSSQTTSARYEGLIAEVFTTRLDVDLTAVARSFFETHPDQYDAIALFQDFDLTLDGAFAFAAPLRNDVQGIIRTERPTYDFGAEFGSARQLQVFLQMGSLANYPTDPQSRFLGENNALSILGQEFGHRWLAFLDTDSPSMLGRDNSHWSFLMHTSGSVLEGNTIEDRGGGSFRTAQAVYRYSPLDQYVMGLRSAAEVPPWFVVTNPFVVGAPAGFPGRCRTASTLPTCSPTPGVDLTGVRRDIAIEEIISAVGPRIPAYPNTQRGFRVAFILLTERGKSPRQTSVDRLDAIRSQWEPFFKAAVENRGSMDTALLYFPPEVTSFSPSEGGPGTVVTLRGSGFVPTAEVFFDSTPALVTFRHAGELRVTVPPRATGTVRIMIRNPADGRTTTTQTLFTYVAGLTSEVPFSIAPGGIRRIETTASSAGTLTGSARLDNAFGAAVLRLEQSGFVVSELAVSPSPAATSLLTYAERDVLASTGIAIVNPSTATANVSLQLSDGGQVTLSLAPQARTSRFIHELFPSTRTPFAGSLLIRSNVPVSVMALRGTTNAAGQFIMTTVPVHSGEVNPGALVVPQVAAGGGYTTELLLLNPGAVSVRGTLAFSFITTTDRGAGNRFNYDIPAGGVWRVRTAETGAIVRTGYAAVQPERPGTAPVTTAVLGFSSGGVLKSEAGVSAVAPVRRAAMFALKMGSRRSVVAIVNPDPVQMSSVRLTAFRSDGSLASAPETTLIIPNGHLAASFDELLPGLPEGFEGTVIIDASVPVHALTLTGRANAAGEYLMTAMPVVDLNAPIPTSAIFPHLADGGGYTTEFLLMPAGGASRLRFFGDDGRALALTVK